ncbi:integral membrane protein GPR155 isoform X2 [Gouania willdenowi]|uniref:integral membrane protein GPR155 isoform X2 n=1 Tax=Gouania willdenowi TaxID=441366 RepID=UPI001056A9E0|nr:integral membrane protein GPR155 isoform X2 [Gouania willdenowi]
MMEVQTTTTSSFNSSGNQPSPSLTSTMSIDKLIPALLECFGIILCGYIAGRTNIITSTQAKGLGNFVSRFALPALLFKNMVLLDFSNVTWSFLWSILTAKVSVFGIVCVLTLMVASPDSRYSKAGIFSIFATQSNDFALGYPIVEALYKSTHPEYLQYIYLVAPVSLMLLNPIGFALCEIQKWKNEGDRQQNKLLIVGGVIFQVIKNPIVFMVVIGIIAHFALHQTIPPFMVEFVDGLANSFGGAALFYLGLSMVGQLGKLTKSTVGTLILLITAKLLLMPLICKDMVDLLDNSHNSTLNQSSLSDYAFIYGVFPTAPSVALYAIYYNTELEVVTAGMVISTFLAAPIMYVTAWLITIRSMDPQLLLDSLQSVRFNISILSLVALVWTIVVMFLSKKIRRLPHIFSVNLFFAQCLTCIALIVWNFVVKGDNFIGQVLIFTILCISLYSTYLWPGLIALSVVLLKKFDDLKVSLGMLVIAGWGVPVSVTAVLLLAGQRVYGETDVFFFYGRLQIICTLVVLSLSVLLTGGSLICLSRESWTEKKRSEEGNTLFVPEEEPTRDRDTKNQPQYEPVGQFEDPNGGLTCGCTSDQRMPDMIIPINVGNTHPTLAGHCEISCGSTDCLLVEDVELQQVGDRQVARHVLLCLLLTVSNLAVIQSVLSEETKSAVTDGSTRRRQVDLHPVQHLPQTAMCS